MRRLFPAVQACLVAFAWTSARAARSSLCETHCSIFYLRSEPPTDCKTVQSVPVWHVTLGTPSLANGSDVDVRLLEQVFEALAVMQTEHFMPEQGTWPEAIDWTAAVMESVLSGVLTSLTRAFAAIDLVPKYDRESKGNVISSFFTQLVSSYFGQDALSLRHQAYDDILWVVLGWIDAIKFVHVHSYLHFPPRDPNNIDDLGLNEALNDAPWYGHYWVPSFAHRARIFWDTASSGWDDGLCDGGMTWNPRLEPYKNAVTNELWIAASISMYLWFPGDNNTSPWSEGRFRPGSKREPKYLAAAIEGYKWLMDVNMTNSAGLFVDGYHISRASRRGERKCDIRSEMVFTYNQGVVLTGQRGLWTATGSPSYLEDGHRLIRSVVEATGWDLLYDRPMDDLSLIPPGYLAPWRGLGRGGVMEERCDASATCSQDGQTFKGIFFHHFVTFCEALQPPEVEERDVFLDYHAHERVRAAHERACQSYGNWVAHNARAALSTRDERGQFGMWWGAGLFRNVRPTVEDDGVPHDQANAADYRNHGIPHGDPIWFDAEENPDEVWAPNGAARATFAQSAGGAGFGSPAQQVLQSPDELVDERLELLRSRKRQSGRDEKEEELEEGKDEERLRRWDPNNRGRGRTAETQNGGLALMRAWWELVAGDAHLQGVNA